MQGALCAPHICVLVTPMPVSPMSFHHTETRLHIGFSALNCLVLQ